MHYTYHEVYYHEGHLWSHHPGVIDSLSEPSLHSILPLRNNAVHILLLHHSLQAHTTTSIAFILQEEYFPWREQRKGTTCVYFSSHLPLNLAASPTNRMSVQIIWVLLVQILNCQSRSVVNRVRFVCSVILGTFYSKVVCGNYFCSVLSRWQTGQEHERLDVYLLF